jgi:excisionase family DNA binding protein
MRANLSLPFVFKGAEKMKLYDVKGAAQVLAVSPWTIRAYIREGKLCPIRMGRLIRLEEQELERFVVSARVVRGAERFDE